MAREALKIMPVDPRSAEAAGLMAALSKELAEMYDFTDDGSGQFTPQDALVAGSGFVVAFLGGQPVACGAYRPMGPGVCEVKRMYVVPEHRGSGLARAVLAELERRAAADGYQIARLETGDRQPAAIRLYERAGYRRIPNFEPYVENERSVCFERTLASEKHPPVLQGR